MLPPEELVDVGGVTEVVVVVLVVLVGPEPGEVVVVVVLAVVEVGGVGGFVPSEGVAEQVLTWRPAVSDASPSGPRGSEGPGGRVPTYALKL